MLVRQQRFYLRMVQKLAHELRKHLAVLQPVTVLREGGGVPNRIVGRKPHEPAVQKIVVQLFHELSFRPDAVEHLQQQSAQQLLRRDRGTSFARVKLPQATVQLAEYLTDKLPGSSSANGSPESAPPAICKKTTRPDPQMLSACKPP